MRQSLRTVHKPSAGLPALARVRPERTASGRVVLALVACCVLALSPQPARALTITFDFNTDWTGFFGSGNPSGAAAGQQARASLLAAGDFYEGLFSDNLTAIVPSPGNTWDAVFYHPATGALTSLTDLTIGAGEVRIYVGARDLAGSTLGQGGPGGYNAGGTPQFVNNVASRGQGMTTGEFADDFARWGGYLSVDTGAAWHYDYTTPPGSREDDFYSVVLHELAHVFGFGTADSWSNLTFNNQFLGPAAADIYGGVVPLDASRGHWADGTASRVFYHGLPQEAAMDPTLTQGQRKPLTDLDVAGLDDLGWDIIPHPAMLTWDGGAGLWSSTNWNLGLRPSGGEHMVVGEGLVTVASDFIGASGPASLVLDGGQLDVTSDGALDVAGPVSVASGAALMVDGLLDATLVQVAPGGLLGGTGSIAASMVYVSGILSPGATPGAGLAGLLAWDAAETSAMMQVPPPGSVMAAASGSPTEDADFVAHGGDVPEPATWLLVLVAVALLAPVLGMTRKAHA